MFKEQAERILELEAQVATLMRDLVNYPQSLEAELVAERKRSDGYAAIAVRQYKLLMDNGLSPIPPLSAEEKEALNTALYPELTSLELAPSGSIRQCNRCGKEVHVISDAAVAYCSIECAEG